MNSKGMNALFVTSQALGVTSQLLAIGIEIGIVAGGYFLYKKLKKEFVEIASEPAVSQEEIKPVKKVSFKSRFQKVKKIFSAVTE